MITVEHKNGIAFIDENEISMIGEDEYTNKDIMAYYINLNFKSSYSYQLAFKDKEQREEAINKITNSLFGKATIAPQVGLMQLDHTQSDYIQGFKDGCEYTLNLTKDK